MSELLLKKRTSEIANYNNLANFNSVMIKKRVLNEWEKKNINMFGVDLSFSDVRESERTKHVHRLHPYLGKFIPQLVEVFLRKYFKPGQWILDPFAGSGTTLIEANVLGINSIGIELSVFNTLICKIKTRKYDVEKTEKEIRDLLKKTKEFSKLLVTNQRKLNEDFPNLKTDSKYLKEWFSERALKEILFYRSLIKDYENQDILKIILSRATRSARLIPHYDLARPTKPVKEKYWCIKHKRYCEPINEALKFINRYSWDTIKRIKEFDKLRSNRQMIILRGDSRIIKLPVPNNKIDGIFTSPPYVGLIDYHDQHKYAYELFGFENNDKREIGSMSNGRSAKAREEYKQGIIEVFKNIYSYLKDKAKVFIVVNDKDNFYPEIAEKSGFVIKDVFHRPVLNRTERDNYQFSESIYFFEKK